MHGSGLMGNAAMGMGWCWVICDHSGKIKSWNSLTLPVAELEPFCSPTPLTSVHAHFVLFYCGLGKVFGKHTRSQKLMGHCNRCNVTTVTILPITLRLG